MERWLIFVMAIINKIKFESETYNQEFPLDRRCKRYYLNAYYLCHFIYFT